MSDRIDEILEVLDVVRGIGMHTLSRAAVRERRLAALKEVALRRGIAPETVRDKFGRQLRPHIQGVAEFDRLLERWLSGQPEELQRVLLHHAVSPTDERRIVEFFEGRRHSTMLRPSA